MSTQTRNSDNVFSLFRCSPCPCDADTHFPLPRCVLHFLIQPLAPLPVHSSPHKRFTTRALSLVSSTHILQTSTPFFEIREPPHKTTMTPLHDTQNQDIENSKIRDSLVLPAQDLRPCYNKTVELPHTKNSLKLLKARYRFILKL